MKRILFLFPALVALVALGSAFGGCAPVAEAPAAAPAAPAAPPEPPFYEGKTIRFVVGFAPGGGFDTYTRAIAKHFGKHVPGKPTVVVENMTGGGSLIAAKHVYSVAKPDGLTISNFIGGLVLQQALGAPEVDIDMRKFEWIGVPVGDNAVCAVRKDAGFTSLKDAIGSPKPLIIGATAPGSSTDDIPKVLEFALGINLQLVAGYSGTATMRRAADAGEIHGGCWAWESIKVTWKDALQSGDVIVIGQTTKKPLPDHPKVPLARDLAKTEEGRQLLDVAITDRGRMERPYATTPGTPKERVETLRKAFLDTMKDPEFVAEAKAAQLDLDPLSGEEVAKLVAGTFKLPEALRKKAAEILLPK